MTDQLNLIRRAFDERLTALEAGLADPDNSPSIESLVLGLVRIAGDEADAAAREAVLLAQRDANARTAAALADAQQAHGRLDTEHSRAAALRAEIASLKEHLSTAASARQHVEATRQREVADLTAAAAAVRGELEEARRAAADRDTLAAARERELTESAATVAQYREALEEARHAVASSADGAASATARAGEVMRSYETIVAERDSLLVERDGLARDHDRLAGEHERLTSERADFVRAHDALVLQRDTFAHERDDIIRERDREIVRLREEITAARAAAADAAAAPIRTKPAKPDAAALHSPERQSDRQAFSSALGVQIDGEAALLVNLSVTGAQVLSCAALKPAKTVKMLLPSSESPVLCRGRIVWARLEPTTPGKPIRYRAGMFFTATDQAAVQTFITRHGARQ